MNNPWLNYHHLFYFWTVARRGSIAEASAELSLSQPTISTQLKMLESSLGHSLFRRVGRGLELTDVGQAAFRYSDEIFRLGRELQQTLGKGLLAPRLRLTVGVAQVLPKLIAERLIQPALRAQEGLLLDCREAPLSQLLGQLAMHELDVVLADAPAESQPRVKVFNHLLGECGVSFVASERHAALKRGFPQSLHGAPALLPAPSTMLRRSLDGWFSTQDIEPNTAGEFEDSALMKAFGHRGLGWFAVPTAIEKEVCEQYQVKVVGRTDEIRERFYAISVERQLKHPSIITMVETARTRLFD